MKVEALELTNFRSYERAHFELHPEVTIVAGPNASGKTNLLESLYVLASTKSFRAHDRDLVRHEQDHFRLVAHGEGMDFALGMSTAGGGVTKKITHDGAARTLAGHVGMIQVTLFEPTELELLAGPPEGRRRYMDLLLCQTDPGYLKTLQLYRRVLRQRNALLSSFDVGQIKDQIFTWDVKLADLAVEIYRRRLALLEQLNSAAPGLYGEIAGADEALAFTYVPSVSGDYAAEFVEELARNLARDLGAGFTTIGPHREDFKVAFKNNDIIAVASRGEVRTVVLAMKLAELDYALGETGVRPVLLLDDVFSELDRQRRGYLLERLRDHQTLITTTDADAVTREVKAAHSVITTGGLREARHA